MNIRKYFMLALLLPFVYSAQSYSAPTTNNSSDSSYVAERGGRGGGGERREGGGEHREGGEGHHEGGYQRGEEGHHGAEAYHRGYQQGSQGGANINIEGQQQQPVYYPEPAQFDNTAPQQNNPYPPQF